MTTWANDRTAEPMTLEEILTMAEAARRDLGDGFWLLGGRAMFEEMAERFYGEIGLSALRKRVGVDKR